MVLMNQAEFLGQILIVLILVYEAITMKRNAQSPIHLVKQQDGSHWFFILPDVETGIWINRLSP